MDKLAIGILAHVDAGKTTLSEGIMYLTGKLRRMGRVDHGDAFLDNFVLERSRGITIFSKQAVFPLGEKEVTLLDTPGHIDFSAEMERTLTVLNYAVLVISGPDGVQGHTETLWRLLREYGIPTFLFINKMDQPGTDRDSILNELKHCLDEGCIAFDENVMTEEFLEEVAMCDEDILEEYMNTGNISLESVIGLIQERKVFPCYFGSALKLSGIEELLCGMEKYTRAKKWPDAFGARIYKISRDEQGNRLTHLKVTGGTLTVKMPVGAEKIDQIWIYSGAKYHLEDTAEAGTVCAVTGLSETKAGEALGDAPERQQWELEPVLSRQIILPEGYDTVRAMRYFKELEEEEPQLHITWNAALGEIQVQIMGEVQTEILKSMIEERYGIPVSFGEEHIMYKETIQDTVTGVGHYEPLRHYAEVHLKMEPGEPGSGLVFGTVCSEDELDGNWQRLILTHLGEREHKGVLTGSPITDMKITVTAGKAHLKHTEGGDFRQATYRAVRQGLMQAKSVLLEPWYSFRLELPAEQIGRGMADIQKMYGTFSEPEIEGNRAVLTGSAPAVEMKDYQKEVWAYSGGRGRLFLRMKGYEPCHNEEEVIAAVGYDSEADTENPSGSVFCAHGAGYFVPWQEVPVHMHIKEPTEKDSEDGEAPLSQAEAFAGYSGEEKELEAIFEREFGAGKWKPTRLPKRTGGIHDFGGEGRTVGKGDAKKNDSGQYGSRNISSQKEKRKEYLLVDGYNIIFAWEELSKLAEASLDAARGRLLEIMGNYQGFTGCTLIVVFDAYKVKGNTREIYRYHNIHVVYTKEAETADQYIEKTTHELGRKNHVRVATSDSMEQVIVMGQGAERISAPDFYEEVERVNEEIRRVNRERKHKGKNYLFDQAEEDVAQFLEDVRLGHAQFSEEEKR